MSCTGSVQTKNFADWLTELLRVSGYTVMDVARQVGVSHTSVSRWANGVAVPGPKHLRSLARLFGADELYLAQLAGRISGEERRPADLSFGDVLRMLQMKAPVVVPVRGTLAAGPGAFQNELYLPEKYRGRNVTGFYITGDCLEPDVMNGSYVAVDLDGRWEEGAILACQLESGGYVCKKYFGDELRDNKGNRIPTSQANIIGRVVQITRDV